jgi:hypothetical protein
MTPLRTILDKIREHYRSIEIRYLHPSLYIICVDDTLINKDLEERHAAFCERIGIGRQELEAAFAVSSIMLHVITKAERMQEFDFLDTAPAGHHWIEFLAGARQSKPTVPPPAFPVIHFYGYKGGQARSTVLAMLSKALADDGHMVLAIDADIEAPSLQAQLDAKVTKAESTLLGCVQYGLAPSPQPVYLPKGTSQGRVDLIACRPSDSAYDLDLATFALHSALSPSTLQAAFGRILSLTSSYDVALVDHRSGIASSVLPLAAAFAGSVIICVRLDEQSDEADAYFQVLLQQNPDKPGLFLSFSLDPDDTSEKLLGRNRPRVDSLLEILADAIRSGAADTDGEGESTVSADDLVGFWVSWFHDRSFLVKSGPMVEGISTDNRLALARIRERIGLQGSKAPRQIFQGQPIQRSGARQLTNNGNTDQGLLIQTEALRRLTTANSPYTYILGRKGTGKTRLVRTLVEQQRGTPLLVADDFPDPSAIVSSDLVLKDLADLLFAQHAGEKLWWVLLDSVSHESGRPARQMLQAWLETVKNGSSSMISANDIATRIKNRSQNHVYLIDGVETAFNSNQMNIFVEGLFRFLNSAQSDAQLAQKLTVRLFIRTDLVRFAVENVEQQVEGRSLRLSWDTQSILNFALSRICDLDWFRSNFRDTATKLDAALARLEQGAVPESECNDVLLEIFPSKLRRNNLYTLTFLKDYFSEGVGDSASFYPRIYDTFLRSIADPSLMGVATTRVTQIGDGRVAQPLIIAAHDYASKEYLTQVAAELKNLLRLSTNPSDNQVRVERLLEAFGGLATPFQLEQCLPQVHGKLSDSFEISREDVRDAMQQMKRVGIFEDRPGYPGWWRAGRLFKNALGMKYVR